MAALYEYMNDDELMIAQESAINENEAMKFDHQFQILALEHEMRIHDIDTQALVMNYTEAVLEDSYAEELRVYEEGVKEAWESFKKWFMDLINKILGKTNDIKTVEVTPEVAKKKFTLPFDLSFVVDKIKEIGGNVRDLFKKEDGSVSAGKVAAGAVSASAIVAAVIALKKHLGENKETEVTVDNATKAIPVIESVINKIKAAFPKDKDDNTDGKLATIATNTLDKIVNTLKAGISKVANVAKKAGDAVKDVAGKVADAPRKVKNAINAGTVVDEIEESTNYLLASMEEIEFMQEAGMEDMLTESVSAEDMKEISDLLDKI